MLILTPRIITGGPLLLGAHIDAQDNNKCLLLLDAHIDTQDNKKWTPLHSASASGRTAVVRHLLMCGASQNIKSSDGRTARDFAKYKLTKAVFRESK